MPTMGKETPAGAAGVVRRTAWAAFLDRRFGFDFIFLPLLATPPRRRIRGPTDPSIVLNHLVYAGWWMLSSRANRRTNLADCITSRCVLAISCLRPIVLFRAFCFSEINRT